MTRKRGRGAAGILIWVLAGSIMALTGALAPGAMAQTNHQATLDRIVAEEMDRTGAPAMTALAILGGEIVAQTSQGVDAPQTAFPAGSVTKVLTAALVMQQVEAGELDLDRPANAYLPDDLHLIDADGMAHPATLRQLLSHSSGLPVTWDGIPPYDPFSSTEAYLLATRAAIHPPGGRVVYSNSAITFAGEIAARAAGTDFPGLAQTGLLDPLGMTNSSFAPAERHPAPVIPGHSRKRDGTVIPAAHADLSAMAAAGALLTTPQDLARFAQMLLGDGTLEGTQVLSPSSVAEMMRLQAPNAPGETAGFGLGFALRDRGGLPMVWWDGTTTAAAAHFALLPDRDAAVIVMASVADNDPTSVAGRRILDALVPLPDAPAYVPPPGALEAREGAYRTIDFVDPQLWFLADLAPLELSREADGFRVDSEMFGTFRMHPAAPDRFVVEGTMLDGQTALFDGDMLTVGFVRAAPVPALRTPLALTAYAVLIALTVLGLVIWGGIRLVRMLRRRRRG